MVFLRTMTDHIQKFFLVGGGLSNYQFHLKHEIGVGITFLELLLASLLNDDVIES